MNETDVIGHLIQIESEAADMLLNAQAEADKRITEAKQKADNIYKEKYENLINELENSYNQQKKQIDEEIQIKFDSYKEKITTPCRTLKETLESNILLDIIGGKTSQLYEEMLTDGLINTTFDIEYFEGFGYSAHIFNGESTEPEKVRERINNEIEKMKKQGIDKETFDRIKKKHYGGFIMNFNDIDSLANALIGGYFNGDGLYDQLEVLESITLEDINNRLNAINIENSSMSIIKQS